MRVMAGALEGDMFIGRRAQEYRGLLKIRYPMEHGIVTNWEDMEKIWAWVYQEELGTLPEEVCIEMWHREYTHKHELTSCSSPACIAPRPTNGSPAEPQE